MTTFDDVRQEISCFTRSELTELVIEIILSDLIREETAFVYLHHPECWDLIVRRSEAFFSEHSEFCLHYGICSVSINKIREYINRKIREIQ